MKKLIEKIIAKSLIEAKNSIQENENKEKEFNDTKRLIKQSYFDSKKEINRIKESIRNKQL